MKLFEITGTGRDRGIEADCANQMQQQSAQRGTGPQTMTGASAVSGFWLISREGKKLA